MYNRHKTSTESVCYNFQTSMIKRISKIVMAILNQISGFIGDHQRSFYNLAPTVARGALNGVAGTVPHPRPKNAPAGSPGPCDRGLNRVVGVLGRRFLAVGVRE
jgi:hypothetical protein